MGGITLRQKGEQNQSVAKGFGGVVEARRVRDSGGIDWVGNFQPYFNLKLGG